MVCATSFENDAGSSFFEFTALPLWQVRPPCYPFRTFQRKGHPHPALSRSATGTSRRKAGLGASMRRPLCSARRLSPCKPSKKRDHPGYVISIGDETGPLSQFSA